MVGRGFALTMPAGWRHMGLATRGALWSVEFPAPVSCEFSRGEMIDTHDAAGLAKPIHWLLSIICVTDHSFHDFFEGADVIATSRSLPLWHVWRLPPKRETPTNKFSGARSTVSSFPSSIHQRNTNSVIMVIGTHVPSLTGPFIPRATSTPGYRQRAAAPKATAMVTMPGGREDHHRLERRPCQQRSRQENSSRLERLPSRQQRGS